MAILVLAKCVQVFFMGGLGGILIAVTQLPKIYDTNFQVHLHQAHQVVTKETSRRDRHGNKETPPGCDISSLANVSLVIHCRNTFEICESRRSLLERYAPFFKDMTFLVGYCDAGDPYLCVARKMSQIPKEASGILYTQFDLGFSPCKLAQQLDVQNLGVLSTYVVDKCRYRTFEHYDFHENWAFYEGLKTKVQCRNVADAIDRIPVDFAHPRANLTEKQTVSELLRHGFWHSWSDIFFVPRSAFGAFQILVTIWAKYNVFHEMALPPIFNLTSMLTGLDMKPLNCSGGTSVELSKEIIESKDFLCGHRINYTLEEHRQALHDLLNTSATAARVSTKKGEVRREVLDRWGRFRGRW